MLRTPIPWLPLTALCPACPSHHNTHEPHQILGPLLDVLNLSARDGLFVDVGTSFDMTEGVFALRRGFEVVGIEARHTVHVSNMQTHNASVASGTLTLLHAALGGASHAGEVLMMYNAHDASTLDPSFPGASRYIERGNPLMKEAVVTTTLDSVIGNQRCVSPHRPLNAAASLTLL